MACAAAVVFRAAAVSVTPFIGAAYGARGRRPCVGLASTVAFRHQISTVQTHHSRTQCAGRNRQDPFPIYPCMRTVCLLPTRMAPCSPFPPDAWHLGPGGRRLRAMAHHHESPGCPGCTGCTILAFTVRPGRWRGRPIDAGLPATHPPPTPGQDLSPVSTKPVLPLSQHGRPQVVGAVSRVPSGRSGGRHLENRVRTLAASGPPRPPVMPGPGRRRRRSRGEKQRGARDRGTRSRRARGGSRGRTPGAKAASCPPSAACTPMRRQPSNRCRGRACCVRAHGQSMQAWQRDDAYVPPYTLMPVRTYAAMAVRPTAASLGGIEW